MKQASFLAACAAAIAIVAGAYSNFFGNTFHFDDSHVIETNLYLRSLANVPRFFTDAHTFSSLPQNATYRPLVTLTLAWDYARAGGLSPEPFHVTQFALLLLLGAMLTAFFAKIVDSPWLALFCATLYCVHTANSETMNLISARSELISAIGLIGSFLLYQRSAFARRTLLYLLPLAIGALAKAPVVVFAPLLFFYALLIEKRSRNDALRAALPPLVLGIALLAFLNSMNAPEWTSGAGSRYRYLITQPYVWLHYARLFVLPIGLTADTDLKAFSEWYDTRAVAGYAFLALLVFWYRRASAPVKFGIIWFAIALIPTSLFPLAEVANEHRIFFAYIGLVVAAVIALWERAGAIPQHVVTTAAVFVLLAHAIGTHERNETWKTKESLWADVVAKSPGNGRAWMNYGLTQMARGDYLAAKASFDRAATLNPNYSVLEINQGIVEGQLGHQDIAERHFRRALELNPDGNSNFFYARWLVQRGRGPEALPLLRRALEISSGFADARALLLRLYFAIDAPQLGALVEETRRIDPANTTLARGWTTSDAAFRAGLPLIRREDWLGAAEATRHAVQLDPNNADAWNNLGWSLAKLGFRGEAARAYERTLALKPDYERARNNLRALGM